jgi:hypothetical protein
MLLLLRLYINALVNGNPIAVAITVVGVVALSVGPFHEGISHRDPAAIALMVVVGLMFILLLAIAIIDRRRNRKTYRPGSRADRR